MSPALEQAKTVHALARAATVIGGLPGKAENCKLRAEVSVKSEQKQNTGVQGDVMNTRGSKEIDA
jgi:hypothetical protein